MTSSGHSIQEKLDHLGIVGTIVGTPVSALMARHGGHMPPSLAVCTGGLLVCAFLAPKPRTIGFCGFAFALCTWLTSFGKMGVLLDLGLCGLRNKVAS